MSSLSNADLDWLAAFALAPTITEQSTMAVERSVVAALVREVRTLRSELHQQCNWCRGEEPHDWNADCPRMLRCRGVRDV
jgi:hypothetical protein